MQFFCAYFGRLVRPYLCAKYIQWNSSSEALMQYSFQVYFQYSTKDLGALTDLQNLRDPWVRIHPCSFLEVWLRYLILWYALLRCGEFAWNCSLFWLGEFQQACKPQSNASLKLRPTDLLISVDTGATKFYACKFILRRMNVFEQQSKYSTMEVWIFHQLWKLEIEIVNLC